MQDYRFKLEKYHGPSSKHTCPGCGCKRRFVRYIDTEERINFPYYVGKCDRINNCGYHYPPKQYFKEHPNEQHDCNDNVRLNVNGRHRSRPLPSFVSLDIMKKSMCNYEDNNFVIFLHSLFDDATVNRILQRYHIGTSRKWKGATVFWQVDTGGRVHHGKVMVYDATTGHRSSNCFSTAECILHLPDFNLQQCFFGEHLLRDANKPVALVESEKSAIIASEIMPQFHWLASGGSSGCLNSRMHILSGRNVVMFPDLKCLEKWRTQAVKMKLAGTKVEVSDYLENHASSEELSMGLDIADFIINEIRERQILNKK